MKLPWWIKSTTTVYYCGKVKVEFKIRRIYVFYLAVRFVFPILISDIINKINKK